MADTADEHQVTGWAMKDGKADLLEAAADIGRKLCAKAYWHEERCNWVGRSPRELSEPGAPITPTVTALGPELYTGTSGIGLFLAHLSARTDLVEARATACAAIRQSLCRSDDVARDVRRGLYSGLVGIAYAAAWVGMLTDEPQLVERGLRLAHRSVIPGNDNLLDVIGGNAGALAPLLWLARLPGGERLADGAIAFAEELAAAATKRDATWCWNNDRACGPGVGSTPLCGLAHGAAGMGLALIEAGVACGRDDWLEGGLAAFRYEDQLYDTRHENWPDLRERGNRHDDPSLLERPSFMVAWCHGAAGIGLTRLRAIQLVPERRAELIVGAKRALRATIQHLRTLPTYSDASPCHGRAGLAETLLFATEVLDDPEYANQARRMWRLLVRTREEAPWTCGVPSGRYNPSFMLGYAGIGYGLLRAGDPKSTPSLLLIGAEDLALSKREPALGKPSGKPSGAAESNGNSGAVVDA
jgi:lantibiotic biosynthesis protein